MADKDNTFFVKIERGAWSTVKFIGTQEDCEREAAQMNEQYQTDEYFVEGYDETKVDKWTIRE